MLYLPLLVLLLLLRAGPCSRASLPATLPRVHLHCQPWAFAAGATSWGSSKALSPLLGFTPPSPSVHLCPRCCSGPIAAASSRPDTTQSPPEQEVFMFFPLLLVVAVWNKTQWSLSIWRPGKAFLKKSCCSGIWCRGQDEFPAKHGKPGGGPLLSARKRHLKGHLAF